jgi:DNA processing protein
VREIIGRAGEFADEVARRTDPLDGLTDGERRIYEALPGRGARTADEIAVASGLPAAGVLGPLAVLEIAGLIERQEGKWRLARKPG